MYNPRSLKVPSRGRCSRQQTATGEAIPPKSQKSFKPIRGCQQECRHLVLILHFTISSSNTTGNPWAVRFLLNAGWASDIYNQTYNSIAVFQTTTKHHSKVKTTLSGAFSGATIYQIQYQSFSLFLQLCVSQDWNRNRAPQSVCDAWVPAALSNKIGTSTPLSVKYFTNQVLYNEQDSQGSSLRELESISSFPPFEFRLTAQMNKAAMWLPMEGSPPTKETSIPHSALQEVQKPVVGNSPEHAKQEGQSHIRTSQATN